MAKNLERVEAYGDIDELNSVLGLLAATLPKDCNELIEEIQRIQSLLFHLGAWLAATPRSSAFSSLRGLTEADIKAVESAIERMQRQLPDLEAFILPGGDPCAAWAHIARTVCRRAERRVVRLLGTLEDREYPHRRVVLAFLNRLSDYLFVLARYCNHLQGIPDKIWEK